MSFTSLPEPVLHLICALLTPTRAIVNHHQTDTIPSIHRSIINLALTCRSINCFAKFHIATNISLANYGLRFDLFLRTVLESPTYASNVKYLKLCEGPYEERFQPRRPTEYPEFEHIAPLLTALHQLQVLYVTKGRSLDPASIVRRLTDGLGDVPMHHTLEEFRFDHVNQWGEERVVRVKLCRDAREGHGQCHLGGESLTGSLQGLTLNKFVDWSEVQAQVTGVDCDQNGDAESDGDWVDEDEEDSWDEEYEEDSSDYDSEDSSDYEDDWEAEGALGLGGIVDVPAPAKISTRHF